MLLIADSGSTKTDWRLVGAHNAITQLATQGLNPYFISEQDLVQVLKLEVVPHVKEAGSVDQVFFYGSGTGAEEKRKVLERSLKAVFTNARIEVNTDILGAARALCGNAPGVAAILGTGSNTCFYDGKTITCQAPSLGFILGDEGSGAHLGRTFLSALLANELPRDLTQRFFERFGTSKEDILDRLYRQPLPNRYLASFAKFIHQNLKDEQVTRLTADCFRAFFEKQVMRLPSHGPSPATFHCTGSVGFYFSNILRRVAEEKHIITGKILESPIAALTLYHLEG
jgi:N-acetylglucosamine kinase-like BadF-type ATPase